VTTGTARPKMPSKNKPQRPDKAVKIARDLASKAKLIADTRGTSISEYLSELLRPLIARDWPVALKKLDQPPSRED
jgi:hypothetical protein